MDHHRFQRSGDTGGGSSSPPSLASFYLPPHLTYGSRSSSHADPPPKVMRPSHSLEDDVGNLGAINSFTKKLYHMVTTEDPDIISFTPDGLAFHVKDPKRLELEVLPRYFRHSRFQSLVRQLNFYNFRKASKERVLWVYRHKLFRRDRPDLLECLRRKPSANLAKSRLNRSNNISHSLRPPSEKDRFTSLSTRGDISPPPTSTAPRHSGRPSHQRLQSLLLLEEMKCDHAISPSLASDRTSSTSSTHSPSSGRTSEASTPDSEGFPLSPAGLCLFSRKRQRSEGEDSLDHHRTDRELEDEVETLEAFMELSRVRTGPSPTESAATSRDDDMEEEDDLEDLDKQEEEEGEEDDDELEKQDTASCYLGGLRDHHHHDAGLTSGDDHSDSEDVMLIASVKASSQPKCPQPPAPLIQHPRLSPLSDFTCTTTDQGEWSSIQALSCAAWGSTQGLVSTLSEQLPSHTHCQFTVFCLENAPYIPGPTLCQAIHTVLTTCNDVADSLMEMIDMLHLDSQILRVDFQSLVGGAPGNVDRSLLNDRLVRVFLTLALNYLRESIGCLQGDQAEVLQRCHRFWAKHAARFF